MRRSTLMMSIFGMAAILILLDWYFVSPLFFNHEIENPYPTDLPIPTILTATPRPTLIAPITPARRPTRTPIATPALTPTLTPTETITPSKTITASITVSVTVPITATSQPNPNKPASPAPTRPTTKIILVQGHFIDSNFFHKGTGLATIYQTANGSYLLRLDDFVITSGPDLRVLLSPNNRPTDHNDLGNYVELGALQDNIGDQNYAIPAHVDPIHYKSVVIYSMPFQVIFATATLK